MYRPLFRMVLLMGFAVFAASITRAQRQYEGRYEGNITGQVRYADGTPAFNALVSCDLSSGGLIRQEHTDRSGRFQFRVVFDQYVVTVRVPGYVEVRERVELQKTPDQYLDIRLRPDGSGAASTTPRTVLNANVPADAQQEFYKADAAFAAGSKQKTEEGIKRLEKAVTIYPKFLEGELRLGAAYMDLQQWDKAEQAFKKALEIDPKTVNASFALGEIYLRQKKYDEAEKNLRQGLAIENRSWQGHFALGRLYLESGNTVNAAKQIALTIQLNPNFAEAHLLGANILFRAGKKEDALFEYQEYLRLEPKGTYSAQVRETIENLKLSLPKKN